jgi:hypothetical protein
VPHPTDPQSLNRYSYCRNNPLKYIDPSGHWDGFNETTGEYTGLSCDWGSPPSSVIMLPNNISMYSFDGSRFSFGPIGFSAYRPTPFSTFTGNHAGGILVGEISISGNISIGDEYASISLKGQWKEGLTQKYYN